jgi:hypothetical protein
MDAKIRSVSTSISMLPVSVQPRFRPVLDPGFVAASLWNRAYRGAATEPLAIALERGDGSVSVYRTSILPHEGGAIAFNQRYVERLLKFLLWQRGGYRVTIAGDARIAAYVRGVYSPTGARAFDCDFMGERVYGRSMTVDSAAFDAAPEEREIAAPLGRHLEGCRIGFDLGASDRKCAAVVDGQVVFSEEVAWNPSVQPDPAYHYAGIDDSLRRAARHLPRVDAIGGSAAGVYVANEVRVGSLYRAVPRELFDTRIRRLFFDLRAAWNNVPFDVVNDGEVTALAGSMALNDNAVLGVAMDEEGWAVVKPFAHYMNINYRLMIGDDSIAERFGGVDALPTTFLIDREGKIAAVHVGLSGKRDFVNGIRDLL